MGAVMLARRAAIDEVGLLDEDFFLFSEETDWCYRFRGAGWQVLFTPDAEFTHVAGAVHGGRMFQENVRGNLRFIAKHHGLRAAARARWVLLAGCVLRAPRDRQYLRIARWLARGSGTGAARRCDRPRGIRRRACSPRSVSRGCFPSTGSGSSCGSARRRSSFSLPGRMIARALGQRSVAAELAWALAALGGGARRRVPRPLVVRARAVAPARRQAGRAARSASPTPSSTGRAASRSSRCRGVVLGALLWHIAPTALTGDSPFHLARVRKLVELGSLSPWRLDELVGRRSASRLRLSAVACVSRRGDEARRRRSRARRPARERAARAARGRHRVRSRHGALRLARRSASPPPRRRSRSSAFAAGHGGTYPLLARPAPPRGSCSCRPCSRSSSRTRAGRRGASCSPPASPRAALALVHPTYAAFLCIPLAGWLVARALAEPRTRLADRRRARRRRRPDGRRRARAAAARARHRLARAVVGGAAALARPLPRPARRARHELPPRAGSLRAERRRRRRRAHPRAARRARVAAALVAVRARRLARGARGDARAVSFEHLSDAVSLSQSRRAAGFLPFAFAFAGGVAVLSFLLGIFVLPLALAGGRRLPGALAGRLRLPARERRARRGGVVRGGGGSGRARRVAARAAPVARSGGLAAGPRGRAVPPAGRRPRLRALGRGRGGRSRARSRPGSCARCATTCRSAASSSPISRRAIGSRPRRRCSSSPRRPSTSPTRSRTVRTSGART